MRHPIRWLSIIVIALALSGCATTDQGGGTAGGQQSQTAGAQGGETAGATGSGDVEGNGVETSGAQGSEGFTSAALDDPSSPLSERVFYFPFDSARIAPEDVETLTKHAQYLSTHPEVSVSVEGHTDERGSREYNLALGERRAQAVADVLTLNGAAGDQLSVVSYGEEKPAAMGHSEEAWSQNRRVELVYER